MQCNRKTYYCNILKLCYKKNNNNQQYLKSQLSTRLLLTNLSCFTTRGASWAVSNKEGVFTSPTFSSLPFKPHPTPLPEKSAPLPDNIIIVPEEEFLAVLSGVINHADSSHEVNHLFACRVVQVVAALVTPVPVNPLQPELASGSCPIRHDNQSPLPTSTHRTQPPLPLAPSPAGFAPSQR